MVKNLAHCWDYWHWDTFSAPKMNRQWDLLISCRLCDLILKGKGLSCIIDQFSLYDFHCYLVLMSGFWILCLFSLSFCTLSGGCSRGLNLKVFWNLNLAKWEHGGLLFQLYLFWVVNSRAKVSQSADLLTQLDTEQKSEMSRVCSWSTIAQFFNLWLVILAP